jgi:hypothetical protein
MNVSKKRTESKLDRLGETRADLLKLLLECRRLREQVEELEKSAMSGSDPAWPSRNDGRRKLL